MAITTCPHCTSKLTIGDDLIGREVECGSCGRVFTAAADAPRGPARDPWAGTEPSSSRRRPRADDEDEDDDRPRRRRRRRDDDEDDREWAEDQVRQPATMLQVVGWWGVFLGVLNLALAVTLPVIAMNVPPPNNNFGPQPGGFGQPRPGGFGQPGVQQNPQAEAMINAVGSAVGGVVSLVISVVILIGAARMKRLESRGLALTAAYLAMIPCFSPCCLLGLPYGINAVNAMNKAGVREFFDEADRGD